MDEQINEQETEELIYNEQVSNKIVKKTKDERKRCPRCSRKPTKYDDGYIHTCKKLLDGNLLGFAGTMKQWYSFCKKYSKKQVD